MKKVIGIFLFALAIVAGCSNDESDVKSDFLEGWTLDLSGLDLDFSKPAVQKYHSERQRDSIFSELAQEFFDLDVYSVGPEESKVAELVMTVSKESKTITTQLILKKEVDFKEWTEFCVCNTVSDLCGKINEMNVQNPSAEIGFQRDLTNKDVRLFYR